MPVMQPRQLRVFAIAAIFSISLLYVFFSSNAGETAAITRLRPPLIPASADSKVTIPDASFISSTTTSTNTSPQSSALPKPVLELPHTIPNPPAKQPQPPSTPHHRPEKIPVENLDLDPETCIGYEQLQQRKQKPLSEGRRQFPYSRPSLQCRTFTSEPLEELLKRMKEVIKDPDLYRLFENSYPNTLDTTIKWRGYANKVDPITMNSTVTDEELAFVITGDINAMWLRDSASQIFSYLPLLEASTDPDSLASLWRGVINIHARYIIISPYCHSFQPPPESNILAQVSEIQDERKYLLKQMFADNSRSTEHFTTTTPCPLTTLCWSSIANGSWIPWLLSSKSQVPTIRKLGI